MVDTTEHIEYRPRIKEMPSEERPRERLLAYGAAVLSNAELLAIVLRSGLAGQNVLELAQSLLAQFEGLPGLVRASETELAEVKGVGPAKAAEVKAALELGRRLSAFSAEDKPQIKSPQDVANLVMSEMAHLEQEHLKTLLLDSKYRVQSTHTVYVGRLDGVNIRLGDVFREATRRNAAAMVIVHNHPSGDPTPSPEDVQMTKQMVQAGELLGIEVLDHVIIGASRFVGMRDRRLGFS